MMFDNSSWIDRLHDDEALTDNLDDDQAERLLRWGESRLATCTSEADAERVLADMREVNRRAGEGEEPAPLLTALEQRDAGAPPANAKGDTGERGMAATTGTAEPRARKSKRRETERREPKENRQGGEAPSTENNRRPSSTP